MKRDTLFYSFFARSPALLFDLIPDPPPNPQSYRFDSVAVKEPKFEIDGVLLPPAGTPGPVYFCEVQMQPDPLLYERIFAETSQYFYQNRSRFSDWRIIVIYPSRKTEQKNTYPYRVALAGEQVYRIYLDELGSVEQLPLRVGAMVLTTVKEPLVIAEAKKLVVKARQEASPEESRAIIELVATIISYKFEQLSRREIETMLDIPIKETRLYKEIRQEALADGRQAGHEAGRQEGRQEGEIAVILRLLNKRLGDIPEAVCSRIEQLSFANLEQLSDTLLDFATIMDVQTWLDKTTLEDS